MATEQTDAIILRTYPWSETSLIANMYTRDFGKISVVAKGARRPKSPFEVALDLLSYCRVVFIAKSSDSLDILTEAKLEQRFRIGGKDLMRLYAGYYVAELLDRLTDKGDKQPELFELALETLRNLADLEFDLRAIVLRFELQSLRLVGHLPSWRRCVECGREVCEEETTLFSPLACGIHCEPCRTSARSAIRLPGSARATLERFSQNDWQPMEMRDYASPSRLDGTDSPEKDERRHFAVIRAVITKYLSTMLDRKLHLHSYLEELGR